MSVRLASKRVWRESRRIGRRWRPNIEPVPRGGFVGLWIEMKYGRNKTTPEQDERIAALRKYHHRVEVCYDWPAARQIIIEYLTQGDLFDGRA